MATEFSPVVTLDSDEHFNEYPLEKPKDYDDLNDEYINTAVNILWPGGNVLFTPQGRRESELPRKFKQPMFAAFLHGLQEEGFNLNNLAFLIVGTELKGETDYKKWKDTKWNDPHPPIVVNVGSVYTFAETGLEGRILTRADSWARSELAKVVSPFYLPESLRAENGAYKI